MRYLAHYFASEGRGARMPSYVTIRSRDLVYAFSAEDEKEAALLALAFEKRNKSEEPAIFILRKLVESPMTEHTKEIAFEMERGSTVPEINQLKTTNFKEMSLLSFLDC